MTVEFYDCDPAILTDAAIMEEIFTRSARESGATVIESNFHQFTPQGVSGVVVISESHFAVHAWPEHEYAAVDLFTCGESVDFNKAVELIAQGLSSGEWIVSGLISRGIVGSNGVERAIPLAETRSCRSFHLSWEKRFRETGASAISSAMDICDCKKIDFTSQESLADFIEQFLSQTGLTPGSALNMIREKEDEFKFVQLLKEGTLTGSADGSRKRIYLDLFVKKFIDPREAAETAVTLSGASYYRMQPQVRI